jgi:hypothetical protein
MINLSPALLTALREPHYQVSLLTLHLDDGALYFTDREQAVQYGGATYLAGVFFDPPEIEYTAEPKVNEITLRLDAAQADIHALFMHAKWLNRQVSLAHAYYNQSGDLLDVITVWSGLIVGKSGDEALDRATLSLKAASIWADFSATRGRKTNQASQQIHYPNDKGFEYSGRIISDVPWGRAGQTGAAATGAGRQNRGTTSEMVRK